MSNNMIDSLFGETELDVEGWEASNKKKQSGGGGSPGLRFISSAYLKADPPNNVGLWSFLNEGIRILLHEVRDPDKPRIFLPIMCRRDSCEICATGKDVRRFGLFAVIDWLHHFKTGAGETITVPTFKIFYKGLNTMKMIKRRQAKYGHMVGRQWEVTREGEGYSTYYDFMPEEKLTPDFAATRVVETKEGEREYPLIAMPSGWPAPEMGSIYSKKGLTPDYDIDWNNVEHVDLWLKLHFLNTSHSTYLRLAGMAPAAKKELEDEDDVPF